MEDVIKWGQHEAARAPGVQVGGPQHDVHIPGVLQAVTRGHHVSQGHQGAAAEPGAVNEEGGGPGELAQGRRVAPDDERLLAGVPLPPGLPPGLTPHLGFCPRMSWPLFPRPRL